MPMESVTVPGLSVVIATRNRAAFLRELFQSLPAAVAAVPVGVELIVVDNGSTDNTEVVIDEWKSRLVGLIHLREPQPGKSRALNQALRQARAPVLVFIDDDVQLPPDYLAEVLWFFAEHPQYEAAGGRVRAALGITDPELLER